jgi:hypothetical protein
MGQGRTALDKRHDTTTARKRTDLVFLFFFCFYVVVFSIALFFLPPLRRRRRGKRHISNVFLISTTPVHCTLTYLHMEKRRFFHLSFPLIDRSFELAARAVALVRCRIFGCCSNFYICIRP